MSKKVLLVCLGVGINGFRTMRTNTLNGEFSWIHHGLAILGACLKQRGHLVELIDLRKCFGWVELLTKIQEFNPDYVAISISYIDKVFGDRCIKVIKKRFPDTKIIVGGLCPTSFPEEFTSNILIDHIVTNEGEIVLPDIVEGKLTDRLIKGIKPDVNLIPFADRELYRYDYELSSLFTPGQLVPSVTMISGRGCPYQCRYCQPAENKVYGVGSRMRSTDNIMQELTLLHDKYQFRNITWWDDTFTFNKNWVFDFCDKFEKSGIKAEMQAYSRADIICNNESMVKRLSEIGMKWMVIGFENGNNRILDFLNKGTTVEQNLKSAKICRKYGMKVFGLFMFGLPTETSAETYNTYEMIKAINPEHRALFYFTPIPGTHIFQYCQDNDIILRDNLFDIDRTSNYVPKIRGIDYNYLNKLREDLELQID